MDCSALKKHAPLVGINIAFEKAFNQAFRFWLQRLHQQNYKDLLEAQIAVLGHVKSQLQKNTPPRWVVERIFFKDIIFFTFQNPRTQLRLLLLEKQLQSHECLSALLALAKKLELEPKSDEKIAALEKRLQNTQDFIRNWELELRFNSFDESLSPSQAELQIASKPFKVVLKKLTQKACHELISTKLQQCKAEAQSYFLQKQSRWLEKSRMTGMRKATSGACNFHEASNKGD